MNCIAPGVIKARTPARRVCARARVAPHARAARAPQTRFSSVLWESEATEEATVGMTPLRRLGVPDDCAGVTAFLCSDDAAFVTGETIVIAGGVHARL